MSNENLQIVIPDPPGTIRHGQVYRSSKGLLVVGRIFFSDQFYIELIDAQRTLNYRYTLSLIEGAIADGKLIPVELITIDKSIPENQNQEQHVKRENPGDLGMDQRQEIASVDPPTSPTLQLAAQFNFPD